MELTIDKLIHFYRSTRGASQEVEHSYSLSIIPLIAVSGEFGRVSSATVIRAINAKEQELKEEAFVRLIISINNKSGNFGDQFCLCLS